MQDVHQLAIYDDQWFVVFGGVVDITYTGLYDYDGATFLITDGQVRYDYTGPWNDPIRGEVQVVEGMVP